MDEFERQNEYFDLQFYYAREFNDIIGWLRLHFQQTLQIDYWLIKKKKIKKGIIKKEFTYEGRFTKVSIDTAKSPEEISEIICSSILNIQRKTELRNRYIDLTVFRITGACINWKKLRSDFNYFSKF